MNCIRARRQGSGANCDAYRFDGRRDSISGPASLDSVLNGSDFLEEEEEDGGDVSNILGGPVAEEGEEP